MAEAATKVGWTRVAFGEVVRKVSDRVDPETSGLERYVAGEHMDTDDLRIRRWGIIGDGYLGPAFHMRFRPGQVLYGSRRTYLRKVAVPDFEGITANTTFVLESKDPSVLLPELLPFIMQTESFHEHSIKQSKGSVNPYVNFSDLEWYEFALPPIKEQARIVQVLSAATGSPEALSDLTMSAAVALHSLLAELFPMDLKALVQLPKLEDLSYQIHDGTHLPPPFTDEGVPFLLVSNIRDGKVDWKTEKYVSRESYRELTKTWKPMRGDVLYTLVGSFGMPALVDTDEEFTFQRHVGLIRADSDLLLAPYLYWYLRSPGGRRQAEWRAEGLAQKTITLGALRAFGIPWLPVAEQQEVVNTLSEFQASVDAVTRRELEARELARKILSDSLEGPNFDVQ